MTITLYHVPRTISSPIVQLLLELDLVDNPIVVHEMSFADLKSKAHLRINPMGTSPTLIDTDVGVALWESGAIVDYVLERYDVQNQFHPPSLAFQRETMCTPEQVRARAKYLQLKQYIIATVYPFIASLYIHSLKDEADQDVEYMSSATHKWRTLFAPVIQDWLDEGPFFLGDQISAVSFLMAKPLGNVHAMGLLHEFPVLLAFYERVASRPTYRLAYHSLRVARKDDTCSPEIRTTPSEVTQSLVLVPNTSNTTTIHQHRKHKQLFTWSLRRSMVTPHDANPTA